MKLFYITTPERARFVHRPWHSLPLGEKVLLCVDWKDEHEEFHFANQTDVIKLPHPIFQANDPLTDEHHQHLCVRFQLEKGHNIHHMIKQAAVEDLWMRLHVL